MHLIRLIYIYISKNSTKQTDQNHIKYILNQQTASNPVRFYSNSDPVLGNLKRDYCGKKRSLPQERLVIRGTIPV